MSTQIISKFVKTKVVDVLVGSSEGEGGPNSQKVAKNSEEIKAGTSTLSVGQKIRFDTVPVSPAGKEYPGNDPTMNGPEAYGRDGNPNAPIIEWALLKDDGTDLMQSGDNPFHLGSYEDNGGCTPTLKQERQLGEGRTRLRFGPYVDAGADYNNGVGVAATDFAEFYVD